MPKWIVTNCESVGNMHDICQDHTEYRIDNNVYVGALADGLSSNRYSDKGAAAVTKIACTEMCNNFKKYYYNELSSKDFVHSIQTKMKQEYAKEYNLNQMKSTLLLCAIHKNMYILGHIGDGAILCFGKESYVISPPQKNNVGGTATYTILDSNADENFEFKKGELNRIDGFLLTSDGLLGNVYYSGTDIPQLAFELFGSVYNSSSPRDKGKRDEKFKKYLAEYIQKGNDLADDCSLFMIAREKKTGQVNYKKETNGFKENVKWPCRCGYNNRLDEIRCANCRTMYLELYSPAIIQIKSKEGFFSKLNDWIATDSEEEFNPGSTADIIEGVVFDSVCKCLHAAAKNSNMKPELFEQNSNDDSIKNNNTMNKQERNSKEQNNYANLKRANRFVDDDNKISFIYHDVCGFARDFTSSVFLKFKKGKHFSSKK